MSQALTPLPAGALVHQSSRAPAIITASGAAAGRRYIEFFTVTIRNKNTRLAYDRAVTAFFAWLDAQGFTGTLTHIQPVHVAAYIEMLCQTKSKPTAKQALAAIRMLGDYLVTGQILATNPATCVKGPAHSQARGTTPHLSASETRQLLHSIPTDTITGLRDRALIGVMAYAFARISAALAMKVSDLFTLERTLWLRLHEKGGKQHDMPCHHQLAGFLDEYLDASGLRDQPATPLFRSATRSRPPLLTDKPLHRNNALAMVKRRARAASLDATRLCNHSFRATGITNFLENGGDIEQAQKMAAHSSIKTTQVYDHRSDAVTVAEVERIRF